MRKGSVLMWSLIALLVSMAISGLFIAKTRKIGSDYMMLRNTVPDIKLKVCSLNALTLAASEASGNGVEGLENLSDDANDFWNEFEKYVESVSNISVEASPKKYKDMTSIAANDSVIKEDCNGVDLTVMLFKDDGKYYLVSEASDTKGREFSWAVGKTGGSPGGGNGNDEDDEGDENSEDEDVELSIPPSHDDPLRGEEVDIDVNGSGYIGRFTGTVKTNEYDDHHVYGINASDDVEVSMSDFSGEFTIADFQGRVKILGTGYLTGISGADTKITGDTISGNIYINRFRNKFHMNGNTSVAGIISKSFEFKTEADMSGRFYVNYWSSDKKIKLHGNSQTCGIVTKNGDLKFDLKNFSGDIRVNYFDIPSVILNGNSWLYGLYSNANIELKVEDNSSGRFIVNRFRYGLSMRSNSNLIGMFSRKDTKIYGMNELHVNEDNNEPGNNETDNPFLGNVIGIYTEDGVVEIKDSVNVKVNNLNSISKNTNAVAIRSGKDLKIYNVNTADFYGKTCVNGDLDIKDSIDISFHGMVCVKGDLKISNSSNIIFFRPVYVEGEVENNAGAGVSFSATANVHEGEPCPFSCDIDVDISGCRGGSEGENDGGTPEGTTISWTEVGG